MADKSILNDNKLKHKNSELDNTLFKIVRGSGILLFSLGISLIINFITRPALARNLSVSEYGIYSLAITIVSISTTLATFGFLGSIPRWVSYYNEKKKEKINDFISTSLIISIFLSIITLIFLIVSRRIISLFFNEQELSSPLLLISFSVPFTVLLNYFSSITQGFGRVKENAIYVKILRPLIFLFLVIIFIIFKLNYIYLFSFFSLSYLIPLMMISYKIKSNPKIHIKPYFNRIIARRLVIFSSSLLFIGIINFFMVWTDTIMIGYYKGTELVGLYNAATPLGKLFPLFLTSFSFLYNPIATKLYIQNKIQDINRIYQIITKWIFLLTIPLFLFFFLFSDIAISFIFGDKYLQASNALMILSIGFMFHTAMGLNGITLVAIGKPKLTLLSDFIAVIFNAFLNIFLIPIYGLVGAAIATCITFIVANLIKSFFVYKEIKVNPFSISYIKIILISLLFIIILIPFTVYIINIFLTLFIIIIIWILLIVFSFLFKGIDKNDINIINLIRNRMI